MAKPDSPKKVNHQPPPEAKDPVLYQPPASEGRAFLPLDQIDMSRLRTRELNEKHVATLAESIAALGLIHPPAVDRRNCLLAGAHRLAALRLLEAQSKVRFMELFPEGIPVWRMDLNSESDIDLALAVEISENEQRRDYDTAEILRLADRLKAAGFHYSAEGGRPKTQDRPLMPALEVIVGKSVRQLRRILNPPTTKKTPVIPKTRPSDLVSELKQILGASEQIIDQLGPAPEIPSLFHLKAQLERVNRFVVLALAALEKPEK